MGTRATEGTSVNIRGVMSLTRRDATLAESGIGTTTPVGQYSPQGDSPYGCADMAGNVWEWTSSLKRNYPYRADDGREDQSSSDARVLRGGSFNYGERATPGVPFAATNSPSRYWDFNGVRCGVGAAEEESDRCQ